jgi:hypothetical protein
MLSYFKNKYRKQAINLVLRLIEAKKDYCQIQANRPFPINQKLIYQGKINVLNDLIDDINDYTNFNKK